MRWIVFAILVYVTLALQEGLRTLLYVEAGGVLVSPSFALVLAVFVGLWAQPWVAVWAWLILGVLSDLEPLAVRGGGSVVLVGPMSLGFLAGAYVTLQLRAVLNRESVVALAAAVLVAGLFVHLVAVALLNLRGLPWQLGEPVGGTSGLGQLLYRTLELLYSAVLSIPLGLVLRRLRPFLGLDTQAARGIFGRMP